MISCTSSPKQGTYTLILTYKEHQSLNDNVQLKERKEVIKEEKQGKITNPLTNRPALYGVLLNGSKTNFFFKKELPQEIKELFQTILANYEKTN